jgi:predicted RNA-binding protein with PIN domain
VEALPEAVRSRIVALGAEALDGLRNDQAPGSLRQIARFAPAKRAKLGAAAIAAAVDADAGFRARVLEAASRAAPDLVEAVRVKTIPAAADPVDVAAVTYLLRPPGWEDRVAQAVSSVQQAQADAQRDREATITARLREQLDAARASAREARDRLKADLEKVREENTTLRRKLYETRDRLKTAESERDIAQEEAASAGEAAAQAHRTADADLRRLRSRVAELEASRGNARRTGRDERDLATARLGLLLDTLGDAAAGLRRELALPASALHPADTVEAAESSGAAETGSARALDTDDPRMLEDLLALPRVHLVVDGYNVTKSAWPSTPLESQRNRLVQGLASLSARTNAEVTCVFDGADVSVPPAVVPAQNVRVRFSRAGETADDLIRRLVRAEPEGRPVVVVSSDREIADGVRRRGVRPVKAAALEKLLR